MKRCSICGIDKDFSEFNRVSRRSDALRGYCKVCHVASSKKWIRENPDKRKDIARRYEQRHADELKAKRQAKGKAKREYDRRRYVLNKERIREYQRAHKEEILEYQSMRAMNDIEYRLAKSLRRRIWGVTRKGYKSGSGVRDLGCTVEELKSWLESKFEPGMSWDNYGFRGWHIDHKIPLSKFNLNDRSEFLRACHYTNLQPMWGVDNIRKGNKILTI